MLQKNSKNYEELFKFLCDQEIESSNKGSLRKIKSNMSEIIFNDFKEICDRLGFKDEIVVMKMFVKNRGDLDNTKLDLKFFMQNNQEFEESSE